MKILVTGATGFVGRWLIRDLQAAGHEAIGTPGSAELDITDEAAVAAFAASIRPDTIAHLAGMSYGPDARRDPERAMAINEGGTRSVMLAAAGAAGTGSAPVPVLIVSSSEVYGDPAPADLPLRESAPLATNQPYGLSKLAEERVAFELAASERIPLVVARAFNHAGPGQREAFVIPALAARLVAAVESGNRTIKAGNVDVRRDFTDVRDVVRAYYLLLKEGKKGQVYNVCSGIGLSIKDIIDIMAKQLNIEVDINIDNRLIRPADNKKIIGSNEKIKRELGWQNNIPLEQSLKDINTWTLDSYNINSRP